MKLLNYNRDKAPSPNFTT